MSTQTEQVWETLRQAGLTEGAAPETGKLESPWYVKILLAFSGWLAAVFLLGFIGMGLGFVFESSGAAMIIGGMMIGGAFALLRISKNEFVEHLALAVSLAGQVLVVFALFDISSSDQEIAWLLLALLQLSLAVVMPNFVHRVFSSFVAAIAFTICLTYWGGYYVVGGMVMFLAALCWLHEFRYPRQMKRIQAIGYGLVLALILLKGTALFGYRTIGWLFSRDQPELWAGPWIGELLTGVVAIYVVWHLLQRYGQRISERITITALSGTILLCGVSMEVQGITVGMVIVLLGFAGANRVLVGLGVLSLLFYISFYYYLLDTTLLAKSQTLLIVGLVLLLLRWLMLTFIPANQEAKHV
jgi:uncharacterized membrane protein